MADQQILRNEVFTDTGEINHTHTTIRRLFTEAT